LKDYLSSNFLKDPHIQRFGVGATRRSWVSFYPSPLFIERILSLKKGVQLPLEPNEDQLMEVEALQSIYGDEYEREEVLLLFLSLSFDFNSFVRIRSQSWNQIPSHCASPFGQPRIDQILTPNTLRGVRMAPLSFSPDGVSFIPLAVLGKMELGLKVTFTPTYPAEVPLIEFENVEGLLDSQVNDFMSILNEMVHDPHMDFGLFVRIQP
jgi:hypothetical protein